MARRDIKGIQDVINKLTIGNKVRATFAQAPYGEFTIEGMVGRTSDEKTWRVGGWLLNMGAVPAKALQALVYVDDSPFLDDDFASGVEGSGQSD